MQIDSAHPMGGAENSGSLAAIAHPNSIVKLLLLQIQEIVNQKH